MRAFRLISVVRFPVVLVACVFAMSACRPREKYFDGQIRIVTTRVVHTDDKGGPLTTDVVFHWQCPGLQLQSVRTDPRYLPCMGKNKDGDIVPVRVKWEWNDLGYYDWHVIKIGECEVPDIDDDDSTWEAMAECEPLIEHGARVGFHCDRSPEGELAKACPWFRRQ